MAKIWGRATSSNVQIAMWAANEVGLDVERIDVGGAFGGTDNAEFRSMNPNGLIPVLEDDDVILFESAAILRYLGDQYGTEGFWPSEPKIRAPLDMWAEWTKTTLCPVLIYQVFWTLVRTPKSERDPELLATQVGELGRLMTIAADRLGDDTYLNGKDFSFADVMFGHTLYRYFTLPIDRPNLPNLDAYYECLKERPPFREHVMVDYGALQVD